jgi:hypothetical protein
VPSPPPATVELDNATMPTSSVQTSTGDHRPRTCLRNISKIKDLGHDIIISDPNKRGFLAQVTYQDSTELVHISFAEALWSPRWKQAMQDEYDALVRNGM